MKKTLGLLTTLGIVLALATAQAATVTWDGGGGDGKWSTKTNWSDDTNGIGSGDNAIFNDTATGTSTMDKGASFAVGTLRYANTVNSHTLALNGNALTVGSGLQAGVDVSGASATLSNGALTINGPVQVGVATGATTASGTVTFSSLSSFSSSLTGLSVGQSGVSDSGNATGVLNLSNVNGGVLSNSGPTYIGTWRGTTSGSVTLGNNWTVALGSSGSRQPLLVGLGGHSGGHAGSFVAGTGGSFTAYLTDFQVGSWANFGTLGSAVGTLDLSGINNGLIDIDNNAVWSGINGVGQGSAGANGTLKLGTNWILRLNSPGKSFAVGANRGTGTITSPGLTFEGSVYRLSVGAHQGNATGTWDLTTGSLGTGLTANGLFVGTHSGSQGTLGLPSGTLTVSSEFYLGRNWGSDSDVRGTLTLNGTHLILANAVGGNSDIGGGGRLNTLVRSSSSGLEITRAAADGLVVRGTMTNGFGVYIAFTENLSATPPPGKWYEPGSVLDYDFIFYGLKWAGDRTGTTSGELGWMLANDRLAWNDSALTGPFTDAVSMFYDAGSNATYIGFYVNAVPEPSALALLALGGVFALRRRREAQGGKR